MSYQYLLGFQNTFHGRPQTFFQGGGGKTYFLQKNNNKKGTIFLKKSKNILFLAG
jgi:hypothetical protein